MRFLYGDSTPFPLGYNFLTTLESFMSASTRIVQLEVEGGVLLKQRDEIAQNRLKGLDALEQFHNVVMRAVQDTATKVQHQHALEYARNVAEFATRYIEEHRRSTLGANEREAGQLRADAERRSGEMRAQLEAFLKAAKLPVVKTKISIRLNLDGKEARHSGTAAFEHPDGLASSFTIAPHRTSAWAQPRRISDFAQGVDLHVGVEKSWLRGTVTPKQLSIDEWTIMQVEVSDELFELVVRKRLTEKDTLVFQLRRNEAGSMSGTVQQPGAPGGDGLPTNLGGQDAAQIERIWAGLKNGLREVMDQKEQLIAVSLDGQSVFENGLAVSFIVRLVAMFAPTVREIAKRSPNEFELTLKNEAEGGRREELYLRKEALVSTLQPLAAKGREVFAPLGLDSWVPSMTNAPPAVMVSEPAPRPARVSEAPQHSNPPPQQHPSVPPLPPPSVTKKM